MSVLLKVKAHPDVSANYAAYQARIDGLVLACQSWVANHCRLPYFPTLAQGYSQSGFAPAVNLGVLLTRWFTICVNGSKPADIFIDLSTCTTGLHTAAELQSCIRAADYGTGHLEEVTVVYDSTTTGAEYYRIQSGRYGESSSVNITFDPMACHVCRALKLTPEFGGLEIVGMKANTVLEDLTAELAIQKYQKLGLEGLMQFTTPGGVTGMTFSRDMSPDLLAAFNKARRLCRYR